jgi:hypothetical protein
MRGKRDCPTQQCPVTSCINNVIYDSVEADATGEKIALIIKSVSCAISLACGWIIAKAVYGLVNKKLDKLNNAIPCIHTMEIQWQPLNDKLTAATGIQEP